MQFIKRNKNKVEYPDRDIEEITIFLWRC